MITPRVTRLVRTPDLGCFRDALVTLACDTPDIVRDRLVVLPTRAAASHLLRAIEDRRLSPPVSVTEAAGQTSALLLPDFIIAGELPERFLQRLPSGGAVLGPAEREVLLGVACREAIDQGSDPPFHLRPGLVAEILRFYDALRRNQKDVDTFERLALGMLEPGADVDRGAARLVRQTRFLVSAFRAFERRCGDRGCVDEHTMRAAAIDTAAVRPWRHLVLAVADRARDSHGLFPADWDLVARVPGLERIDLVVTDTTLAGAFHERIHQWLPGIEEVRFEGGTPCPQPVLRVTTPARDREEELAGFARWSRELLRSGEVASLDRVALVVRQPLPYVYLAREVLRSAGLPCQTFDALPLAAEPYAAALDLVCAAVSDNYERVPAVALLRSPHFRFVRGDAPIRSGHVSALDRALGDAGYLGDVDALERLIAGWKASDSERSRVARALPAAECLSELAHELLPLRARAPVSAHLSCVMAFLAAHENLPGPDDPLRTRQLRARAGVGNILVSLRDAYRDLDPAPVEFEAVAALIRRWIEAHTFAPRTGDSGVHVVDAESARFGDFGAVQLAGLVDGEWPERPRRNVFYSPAVLQQLGWPLESERLDAHRAAFADLLRLPSSALTVSSFSLEDDAVVGGSTLLDEVAAAGLPQVVADPRVVRIFEYEALGLEPVMADQLPEGARRQAAWRLSAPRSDDRKFKGFTTGHVPRAFSLSALERYQECPFKFFSQYVLHLEETPEDETALSPRVRGRFIHEVFQRFFDAWDRSGTGTITADHLDEARKMFRDVAEPMLGGLPDADAAIERMRLFGSAISIGIADVVLGIEASRPAAVLERWLEYTLEGEFSLGGEDGRRVSLKGVADRVDLLEGRRLRVIDYKSGRAPSIKRALQVPIYALCAQERLNDRDGNRWEVDEAAYVAFSGTRSFAPAIRSGGSDAPAVLAAARGRLFDVVDGVGRGEFPPRPHDPTICGYCAFASVCRKDYVGD
ncbi:MAG: PD-(D/E)XK nuclease family protein [Vicinamibacterales bacterium]